MHELHHLASHIASALGYNQKGEDACYIAGEAASSIERQLDLISGFQSLMLDKGFSLRVFNPAGQDDIGGGCGQLTAQGVGEGAVINDKRACPLGTDAHICVSREETCGSFIQHSL